MFVARSTLTIIMAKIAKCFGIILMCTLFSCSTKESDQLKIEFSADSSRIVLKNISSSGLLQLKKNLPTDSSYQKLVSVLQTPADDDSISMELECPGHLMLEKDQLVFLPDTPFVKGKHYLVETLVNTHFGGKKDVLTSDVGHRLKAQQKVLVR